MILVVCGVSGSGKTTIGKMLARELKLSFYDADDFHSAENIEKMRQGQPLDDADRFPWLEKIAKAIPDWEQSGGAVLACSALKEPYRSVIQGSHAERIRWITLDVPPAILRERLGSRQGHFFDQQLLDSQLRDFEKPGYGITVDAQELPSTLVAQICRRLDEE